MNSSKKQLLGKLAKWIRIAKGLVDQADKVNRCLTDAEAAALELVLELVDFAKAEVSRLESLEIIQLSINPTGG